ncbi:MAG: FG-GAP-like repeat-containing protein, partial [Muribaculum sp.]|nr:FG-GAP-like repeat-containing protein [Muribaculum sp.]
MDVSPVTPVVITSGEGFIDLITADISGNNYDEIIKINNTTSLSTNSIIQDYLTFRTYQTTSAGAFILQDSITFIKQELFKDHDGNQSLIPKFFYTGDFDGDGIKEIMSITAHHPIGRSQHESICTIYDLANHTIKYEGRLCDFSFCFLGMVNTADESENNSDKIFCMDIDGDGKTDICHIDDNQTTIYTFSKTRDGLNPSVIGKSSHINKANLNDRQILSCDANNDGLEDFVVSPNKNSQSNLWGIYYSLGNGSFSSELREICTFDPENNNYFLCDANYNGIPDLICSTASELKTFVDLHQFSKETINTSFDIDNLNFVPIRVKNSSSFTSLIGFKRDKFYAFTYQSKVDKENLLNILIDSYGYQHKTSYSRLSDIVSPSTNKVHSAGCDAKFPFFNINNDIFVVNATSNNSDNEVLSRKTYSYENAVGHKQGLGFIGFNQIVESTSRGEFITNYNPYMFGVRTKSQTPDEIILMEYDTIVRSDKTIQVLLKQENHHDLRNGISYSKNYEYDSIGYIIHSEKEYSDQPSANQSLTYAHNLSIDSIYILGLITSETKNRTRNGNTFSKKNSFEYNENKQIISKSEYIGNSLFKSIKYKYNRNGLVSSITDSHLGECTFEYDDYGRITSNHTYVGQFATYAYNLLDNIISSSNSLGQSILYSYNPLGLCIGYQRNNGEEYQIEYNWAENGEDYIWRKKTTANDGSEETEYFDSYDRPIIKSSLRFDNTHLNINAKYDEFGNITALSNPYTGDVSLNNINWRDEFEYDNKLRLIKHIVKGKSRTTKTYNENKITTFQNGVNTVREYDSDNLLISSQNQSGVIRFKYNGNNKPILITNSDGSNITIEYDEYGRRKTLYDLCGDIIEWNYDSRNNIRSQTNGDGSRMTFLYTPNNQIWMRRTSKSLTGNTSYEYNSDGLLTSIISGDHKTSYEYNLGNIVKISSK